ncbi:MAG: ribokinase [Pseudomonadota bacterium]|nr:ribokinase [Pseudomonadota bacterium]
MGIVVLGSINVDLTGRVAHLPRAGETLSGESLAFALGGKGANQAVAVARLGLAPALIAAVGADAFGQLATGRLTALGVPIELVRVEPDIATGTAMILVDSDGHNTIAIFAGANASICLQDLQRAQLQQATLLLIQLETPLAASLAAAAMVRAAGGLVILDPAPCPRSGLADAALAACDVITPNETEAAMLTGIACDTLSSARTAARQLLERGARRVLLKLGARGALLMSHTAFGGLDLHVAPWRVDAIDTVAAGDCFNAGLAVALSEGQSWQQATAFANACGALATTRAGAADSAPARTEVADLMRTQD